jgi:hypothetical protein
MRLNRVVTTITSLVVLGTVLLFATVHNSNKSTNIDFAKPASTSTTSLPRTSQQNVPVKAPEQTVPAKKITTKIITETQPVPFQSIEQNDDNLEKDKKIVATNGVSGVKTITYKVTLADGLETARQKLSEVITTQPIAQIIKIGTHISESSVQPAGPAGATALCSDGYLSYADHHQGACSDHKGVSIWYR